MDKNRQQKPANLMISVENFLPRQFRQQLINSSNWIFWPRNSFELIDPGSNLVSFLNELNQNMIYCQVLSYLEPKLQDYPK